MITWLDEPFKARHRNGFECLIHGFALHPVDGTVAALCVGEDGFMSMEDIVDLSLDWRYDRKRGWHSLEDVTEST